MLLIDNKSTKYVKIDETESIVLHHDIGRSSIIVAKPNQMNKIESTDSDIREERLSHGCTSLSLHSEGIIEKKLSSKDQPMLFMIRSGCLMSTKRIPTYGCLTGKASNAVKLCFSSAASKYIIQKLDD